MPKPPKPPEPFEHVEPAATEAFAAFDAAAEQAQAAAETVSDASPETVETEAAEPVALRLLEAPVEAAEILQAAAEPVAADASEALQDLFTGVARFGQETLQRNAQAFSALTQVRSPQDLLALQVSVSGAAFAAALDEFHRITGLLGRVAGGAAWPVRLGVNPFASADRLAA
ncbi:MAG: phasin family protein [Phenylobacterium sp.]|uniref:phasin family protein n=1 Tax=Phenylobacterium sp. TaxID=1871053 RepID=UPI0027333F71|nr:phasin family protein [Phenylobacterium sp.]MDP3174054.1 phasin family protein [Phenylobacterium sp.]